MKIFFTALILFAIVGCQKSSSGTVAVAAAADTHQKAPAKDEAQALLTTSEKIRGTWEVVSTQSQSGEINNNPPNIRIEVEDGKLSKGSDTFSFVLNENKIMVNGNPTFEILSVSASQLVLRDLTGDDAKPDEIWTLNKVDSSTQSQSPLPPPVEKPLRKVQFGSDFPKESARTRPADKKSYIPIIQTETYTIWVRNYNEDDIGRGSEPFTIVKTQGDDSRWDESATLNVDYQGPGDAFYGTHFARRGIVLKDGSLLLEFTDTSNMNGAYRYSYLINTDSNLVQNMKFGDRGFFRLEATHTNYDYRFIRSLSEGADNNILATEHRCIVEGTADYSPDNCYCYNFKLSRSGKLNRNYGFHKLPTCDGI